MTTNAPVAFDLRRDWLYTRRPCFCLVRFLGEYRHEKHKILPCLIHGGGADRAALLAEARAARERAEAKGV